jgi:hypothetical protein
MTKSELREVEAAEEEVSRDLIARSKLEVCLNLSTLDGYLKYRVQEGWSVETALDEWDASEIKNQEFKEIQARESAWDRQHAERTASGHWEKFDADRVERLAEEANPPERSRTSVP